MAKYCLLYEHVFDVYRFYVMISDGWDVTMYDRAGVRRDTDIGA